MAILRAIIAMGRELGLKLVAEGVETPAMSEKLEEFGFAHFQGYLYGRPQDPYVILEGQKEAA